MAKFRCVFCGHEARGRSENCPHCRTDGLVAIAEERRPKPQLAALISEHQEARQEAPEELRELFPKGLPVPCVVVVTGPPGVGKTTLAAKWATGTARGIGLFATTEQTRSAVAEAAKRGRADLRRLFVIEAATTNDLRAAASDCGPCCIVVDSVDELTEETEDTNARERPIRIMREMIALSREFACVVYAIGQTNKADELSGPRRAEHLADVTLHVGDTTIRAAKNRFGPRLEVSREVGQTASKAVGRTRAKLPSLP